MSKTRTTPAYGPEYERFGRNLAALRIAAGMSQAEFSQKLGVIQSTYAGWETGTRKIQLATIIQLSNFFGVCVDELIGLKSPGDEKESFSLKESEKNFIKTYRKLNSEGKQKLAERADELLDLGYVQKGDVSKMA